MLFLFVVAPCCCRWGGALVRVVVLVVPVWLSCLLACARAFDHHIQHTLHTQTLWLTYPRPLHYPTLARTHPRTHGTKGTTALPRTPTGRRRSRSSVGTRRTCAAYALHLTTPSWCRWAAMTTPSSSGRTVSATRTSPRSQKWRSELVGEGRSGEGVGAGVGAGAGAIGGLVPVVVLCVTVGLAVPMRTCTAAAAAT